MQNKKMLLLIIALTFIDQFSKGLINIFLNLNQSINIIPNFFSLTYVRNIGAAFSILPGSRWFFIIISIIALNIIYIYFIKNKELNKKNFVIFSLLQAGIIGNLIDRVLYGYVIDFFDFTIFGFDFAIFNIADIFIVVSIILLILVGDKDGICSRK
ncbi:MAG: signal peptidase II [Firmicutes bacterium]|nr:signal peptidase II [Bacillota bacterium]